MDVGREGLEDLCTTFSLFQGSKIVLKIKTTKRYSEKVLHFCEYTIFLLVLFACHSSPGAKGGRMAVLGAQKCVETLA